MIVMERIQLARLAEHLNRQQEYAQKIGVTIENRNDVKRIWSEEQEESNVVGLC